MISREKGEAGDDAYRISARLVHAVIVSLLGVLVSLAGYMAVWAVGDAQWKASLVERQINFAARITELEVSHAPGIHPIARERIDQLERRVRELEQSKPR